MGTAWAVVETMRAVEGGRHDVFWLVVAAGIALLAFGVVRLVRSTGPGSRLQPASVALILGGLAMLLIAWAAGGELIMRNPVIYMAIFTAIVWFVLTFTMVGRRLYASGGNPEAARLSGINVTRYKLMAFIFCSGAAGVAGILFASRLRSINPAGLQGAELTVIAAAILGGTSLFGGAGSVIKTLRRRVAPLLAHQRLQYSEPWRQLAGPDRGHRGGDGSSHLHRRRQQDEIENRRLIGKRWSSRTPEHHPLQSASQSLERTRPMAPIPPVDFTGKVAFVTGAGSGIGRATALAFARAGAAVTAVDINADGLASTVREIETLGGNVSSVRCDVTDAGAVKSALDRTVETLAVWTPPSITRGSNSREH